MRFLAFLVSCQSLLLRFFPERFRRRHSQEILSLCRGVLREEHDRGGSWRVFLTGLRLVWDTLVHLLVERRRDRPQWRQKEKVHMETIVQDVRYGLRGLLRRPLFSLTSILTLAVAIGANSATFSLLNTLLWRPLAIERPEELMGCYIKSTIEPDSYAQFSYPNYLDVREGSDSVFVHLAAHTPAFVGITEGDATRRTFADIVSSNYFATFGVRPVLGRDFLPEEEAPLRARRVAIISHHYWTRLGRDLLILGRSVIVNGNAYAIVGVAPPDFTGSSPVLAPEVWIPMGAYELVVNDFQNTGRLLSDRSNANLLALGRLRPGVSQVQADAGLGVLASQLERAFPEINKERTIVVRPLPRVSVGSNPDPETELSAVAVLLIAMASVVLLIASLNLANMQRARSASRRQEFAVRLALGGGRLRVGRQLFVEGFILALVGGAAGMALASVGPSLLFRSLSQVVDLPLPLRTDPDVRVALATLCYAVICTLIFSIGPALGFFRRSLADDLRGERASGGQDGRRVWSRRNLPILTELALALALVVAAGLFLKAVQEAGATDPGFDARGGILLETDAGLAGHSPQEARLIYQRVLERLRGMPQVESASLASTIPFGNLVFGRDVQPAGEEPSGELDPEASGQRVDARYAIVGADYFQALGIPILQGRGFRLGEEMSGQAGARVAVIDEVLAERLWPEGGPLGRWIRLELDQAPVELQVVGLVPSVQDDFLSATRRAHIYVPVGADFMSNMHFLVRTSPTASTETVLKGLREEVRAVEPRLPVLALRTLQDHLDNSISLWLIRTGAWLFTLFGALALFLAMVGVYGVRAYSVAGRRREIGIRMALGASRGGTLWHILREGLVLTSVGSLAGLFLAAGVSQLLSSFLYKVSPYEPAVFLLAPLLLGAISLLACYLPARRASKVDPAVALRYE